MTIKDVKMANFINVEEWASHSAMQPKKLLESATSNDILLIAHFHVSPVLLVREQVGQCKY